MRLNVSGSVDEHRFLTALDYIRLSEDVDMFLSRGRDGTVSILAGISPDSEMRVNSGTPKAALERFAFADGLPTLGFLSYEYGLLHHGLPLRKPGSFPLGHLKKYGLVAMLGETADHIILHPAQGRKGCRLTALLQEALVRAVTGNIPRRCGPCAPPEPPSIHASLDREAYMRGVEATLEHIRAGNTYQLNLSTRFTADLPEIDPYALFRRLWEKHPAEYYTWFTSDPYDILCTSPERFLRVRNGEVLSQPIKGTLAVDEYREGMEKLLTGSPKESAELSMIVDLVRNDISAHCDYGSVCVPRHKAVFRVDNLLHMYSDVTGTLRRNSTVIDLLVDAFPGGSVTGCPKRSSLRIIDELEPHTRDIYCGSLFMIFDERNMDSSIAIRTGYRNRRTGRFHFFAGSGIVVDSDPEREYLETMAKAEKFFTLLRNPVTQ